MFSRSDSLHFEFPDKTLQRNYLQDIRQKGRGILLLHDWSADAGERGEELQSNNRTLQLTKSLIPLRTGFDLVALDESGIST
jgi:hypothetical protein